MQVTVTSVVRSLETPRRWAKLHLGSSGFYAGTYCCTESKAFFTFLKLTHRVTWVTSKSGSLQKSKNSLYIQYIRSPRYDLTDLFRLKLSLPLLKHLGYILVFAPTRSWAGMRTTAATSWLGHAKTRPCAWC